MDEKTLARFLGKITIDENGCWLWNGTKTLDGYGQLSVSGKYSRVHRLSFEHFNGPITPGFCVCHTCDVRACCNPSHLWLGNDAENMADKCAKQRQARGEYNGRAKLTPENVCEIRLLGHDFTQVELARQYKVSPRLVAKILKRESWQHVYDQGQTEDTHTVKRG